MMKKIFGSMLVLGLLLSGGSAALANTSSTSSDMYSMNKGMQGNYKHEFRAHLTGAEEVPPVQTSGKGDSVFHVSGDERTIHYKVKVSNLSSGVTGAHLHCAPKGQNGPVVVPLNNPTMSMGSTSGMWSDGTITESQIATAGATCNPNIRTAPHLVQAMREGMIYANVHTTQYPNGEVRGQLMMHDMNMKDDSKYDDSKNSDYMKMMNEGHDMMKEGYGWMGNQDKMHDGYMKMKEGYKKMHHAYKMMHDEKKMDSSAYGMMDEGYKWMEEAHEKMGNYDSNKGMNYGNKSWSVEEVKSMVTNWPMTAKQAAMDTLNKYGAPQEVSDMKLTWYNNGPWEKTIVYKKEIQHNFPMPHKDVLEQFVHYQVPIDLFDDLAKYDGSVIVERTAGYLSARCDKEELNILALNLAHDIVTGKKTVEEARAFYAETAMKFKNGEKPAYTQSLMFTPDESAGDPDHAI